MWASPASRTLRVRSQALPRRAGAAGIGAAIGSGAAGNARRRSRHRAAQPALPRGAGLGQAAGAVPASIGRWCAVQRDGIDDGPRSPGTSNIAEGSPVSAPVAASNAAATAAIAFCIAVSQSDRMSLSTNGFTC